MHRLLAPLSASLLSAMFLFTWVTAASAATMVAIANFTFDPPVVTVPVGTEVTWRNDDDIPHTVTAQDQSFSSEALDTGDQYSMSFATPGTYTYFCALHPHMTAKVIVTGG